MQGSDKTSRSLFSYVDVEAHITVREIVNDVLASLDPELGHGRESLPHLAFIDFS